MRSAEQAAHLRDLVAVWSANFAEAEADRDPALAQTVAGIESARTPDERAYAELLHALVVDGAHNLERDRARLTIAQAGLARYGLALAFSHAARPLTARPSARALPEGTSLMHLPTDPTFTGHVAAREQAFLADHPWPQNQLVHCLLDANDDLAQNVRRFANSFTFIPTGSVMIPLGALMSALPMAAHSFHFEGMIGCCVVTGGTWSLWSHDGELVARGAAKPGGKA
jgi:hypothetical protein